MGCVKVTETVVVGCRQCGASHYLKKNLNPKLIDCYCGFRILLNWDTAKERIEQ